MCVSHTDGAPNHTFPKQAHSEANLGSYLEEAKVIKMWLIAKSGDEFRGPSGPEQGGHEAILERPK